MTTKIRLVFVGAVVAAIAALGSGPASAKAQCVDVKTLGLPLPALCVPLL